MSCFVVKNETIDAVVMAIVGGNRSSLLSIMNLGDNKPVREGLEHEHYAKIWPELLIIGSMQELGERLLLHNVEAFDHRYKDSSEDYPNYKCNLVKGRKFTDIEMLKAVACYMYQVVDHEQQDSHPIYKLLKELRYNMLNNYIMGTYEWENAGLWG